MSVLQGNSLRYKVAVFFGVVSPPWRNGQLSTTLHCNIGRSLRHYPDFLALEPCCQNVPSSLTDETTEREGDLLGWDGVLWGVPKKPTSHSKKRMHMIHKYLKLSHQYNLKLLPELRGQIEEILREHLKLNHRYNLKLLPELRGQIEDILRYSIFWGMMLFASYFSLIFFLGLLIGSTSQFR